MTNTTISVIIPLYNKSNTIVRAINSVKSQSYKDWELIIIDDGSTDDSATKVKNEIDIRVKYFYQENKGVSAARNNGVQKAIGSWIIFLDADDYLLPSCLQDLYNAAIHYRTDISCANFYVESNNNRYLGCVGIISSIVRDNFRAWFYNLAIPRAGAAIFRTDLIKSNPFDETLSRYEDAKSLFNILRNSKMCYISNVVMVYTLDNNSLSKRCSNTDKDYIFKMSFEGKSYWEKLVHLQLLNEGILLYPEYRTLLSEKYESYLSLLNDVEKKDKYKRLYRRLANIYYEILKRV